MEPDVIAAIASTIIALCALGFTIWQGVQTRRHNRLSVQPHLTTWNHSEHNKLLYTIDLINNGIGPALIKNFSIRVDDKPINGDGSEPIKKALKLLFPNYSYHSYQSYVGAHYMMAAKEKRVLVQFQFTGDTVPPPEEVEHAIKRSRLLIDYESIYKVPFNLDTDDEKPNK